MGEHEEPENPFVNFMADLEESRKREIEALRRKAQVSREIGERLRAGEITAQQAMQRQPGESLADWHERLDSMFGKEEVDAQFAFIHDLGAARSDHEASGIISRFFRRRRR